MNTSAPRVVRPSAIQVVSLTVEVIGDVGKLQFDHVKILWSMVCQTVARGTPLGFREEITMIAKNFSARTHRQFGHFLTLNSFPTHVCPVPDIDSQPYASQAVFNPCCRHPLYTILSYEDLIYIEKLIRNITQLFDILNNIYMCSIHSVYS
jgi:hypothetical protein